ncbi:MAG TPA: S49 family peptidase, partial [Gemmatimonadaceae bacterium]
MPDPNIQDLPVIASADAQQSCSSMLLIGNGKGDGDWESVHLLTKADAIAMGITMPPSALEPVHVFTAQTSPIRVIHRQPNQPTSDRSAPRLVDLDEFMAIQPSAIERSFFGFWGADDEDAYENRGGVAVIAIDGPLMQRGGWWFDGYSHIRKRFEKALDDRDVTAVLLKINSPGGVCAGCFSAARGMRQAKAEAGKPVLAYADESAYSAAYAMACIADEIYLPPEGGVGSVGVIGTLEDWTAYNDRVGIKVAVITSGEYKADGHPDVKLTADIVARYQKRINQLAGSFAELVGASRGMSPTQVIGLHAACLYGDDAVSKGLANGVSTFEETLAKAQQMGVQTMTSRARNTTNGSTRAAKGNVMPTQNKAGSADQNTTDGLLVGELVVSHAEFALATGLPHDASKGDVLAKMSKDKSDAASAVKDTTKLLAAVGASSIDEAVGKLTADAETLKQLVKAITGDEKANAQDAIAKLAAERKATEGAEAKSLIEAAASAGKTAGDQAFKIFEDFGMSALKAHLAALPVHQALVA